MDLRRTGLRSRVIPVMALVALAAASVADATTWRVPDDFAVINNAVNAAAPGDSILLAGNGGSTYFTGGSTLEIDFDLTIQGGWRADFAVRDPSLYISVVRDETIGSTRPLVRVTGPCSVVLDGFRILGGETGIESTDADLTVRDCVTEDQRNTDFTTPGGGLRVSGGTLMMERTTVRDAYAVGGGAGMSLTGLASATLSDCSIVGNHSALAGAGILATSVASLTLSGTTVARDSADTEAGLLLLEGTSLTASDCEFVGGRSFLGSCIRVTGGAVEFTDCRFDSSESWHGGAMSVESASSLTLRGCSFEENRARSTGGAIRVQETPIDFEDCLFRANHMSGIVPSIPSRGGAVWSVGCDGVVESCSFEDEECTDRGGAWYQTGGEVAFEECDFTGNTARLHGGGIYLEVSGTVTAHRCLFTGNTAAFGGALSLAFTADAALSQCTIAGSAGRISGAGVYIGTGADLVLTDSIVCCSLRGEGITCSSGSLDASYSNLFHDPAENNRPVVGGTCQNPTGTSGNIAADPLFCDSASGDYRLSAGSPCVGAASGGGRMGSEEIGCPAPRSSSLESTSWGRVKAYYR
ncbi:MAG: right-handed parallel beta-helix repeat-containing protein [Gemmatimonadota bacterium]|nr:hypothetical protein [Gemmatimonadota bacterium]MDP6528997.1 right-handed parallel beta-helix repeat-containing protein [Gemmatimonadota bacterium]MDP6802262.1 right-handed parallel beta-helix repeat-containing protein [Gemmatimonadota bacterium]MDP7032306.1 right-handed parallel beta-helix repeat-containing protein [Gemmatimonadota bacterium]